MLINVLWMHYVGTLQKSVTPKYSFTVCITTQIIRIHFLNEFVMNLLILQ